MEASQDKRKVDDKIALLLLSFKGILVKEFEIKLPSGKTGKKVLDQPVALDELGAKFFREGAELIVKDNMLSWSLGGNVYTPTKTDKVTGSQPHKQKSYPKI